jgi:hypothetical protein
MRYRTLRIAWSAVCGVMCVLLIVLWAHSIHGWRNHLLVGLWDVNGIGVQARDGHLAVTYYFDPKPINYHLLFFRDNPPLEVGETWKDERGQYPGEGFGVKTLLWKNGFGISMAFWVPVVTCILLASVPWLRWRFSLRTLLITTTLVAVLLGLVVWLTG